jgi:RNA-directed DNA polymerase
MDLWPPHLYRAEGARFGCSDAILEAALAQAHSLQRVELPALLTLRHLAWRTETRYEDLRDYVEGVPDAYRTFRIRKRSGGTRLICIPAGPLIRVQRWLARNVLNRVPPHHASVAYAPGSSIVECAKYHCGSRWLVKIDVRNFFESISEIQAFRVFAELGYARLLAFELGRICTRRYGNSRRNNRMVWKQVDGFYSIRKYGNTYGNSRQLGHLPQGAPTSPMLSNHKLACSGAEVHVH